MNAIVNIRAGDQKKSRFVAASYFDVCRFDLFADVLKRDPISYALISVA